MSLRAQNGSASSRAYEWVRARILDGTFAGGRLISEGEVAEAVELSRTPVREAFLQLAAEGMLELYPKRGALVVSVTAAELRDVLTARALIEPWAARAAAARADRVEVSERLRQLTADAREAQRHGNERAFQEADREFHQHLLAAAGNDLLTGFYASLRDRQLRGGMLAAHNDSARSAEAMAQHDAICEAVGRGDGDAAAEMMERHLNGTALALGLAPLS